MKQDQFLNVIDRATEMIAVAAIVLPSPECETIAAGNPARIIRKIEKTGEPA